MYSVTITFPRRVHKCTTMSIPQVANWFPLTAVIPHTGCFESTEDKYTPLRSNSFSSVFELSATIIFWPNTKIPRTSAFSLSSGRLMLNCSIVFSFTTLSLLSVSFVFAVPSLFAVSPCFEDHPFFISLFRSRLGYPRALPLPAALHCVPRRPGRGIARCFLSPSAALRSQKRTRLRRLIRLLPFVDLYISDVGRSGGGPLSPWTGGDNRNNSDNKIRDIRYISFALFLLHMPRKL